MTPEERQRLKKLETLVASLLKVENVPFVQNMNRRLPPKVSSLAKQSAATITVIVSSTNVAKVPDAKLKVTLSDGTTGYIGLYTS